MKKNGFAPIIILILIALAVVGYFGYKNYWPKLQSIVVPTPIATADPTANWKTYTNTKYGYEFKYPNSWYELGIMDNSENICFSTKNIPDPMHMDLNDVWLTVGTGDNLFKKYHAPSKIESSESSGLQITINYFEPIQGLPASQFYDIVFVISSENKKAAMDFTVLPKKAIDDNKIIFSQILSTFKFTSSNTQQIGIYSIEGDSCGALAGPAGNAQCAAGLTCQHNNPNDPNDIGTCVR